MSIVALTDHPPNSPPDTEAVLEAALGYATRGWPVLPLYTPTDGVCDCPDTPKRPGGARCASPGKHPRTDHGHLDATTDHTKIRRWWRIWPHAQLGIRTGETSGLLVVDVDPRNGGDMSLGELVHQHGPLPDTVEALTGGGGRHIVLAYPADGTKVSDAKLGAMGFPGIEIKAEGGFIVAAPSHHYTGGTYAWDITCHPDDVELAQPPDWLLEMLAVGPAGGPVGEPLESTVHLPLGYAALTFVANGAPLGEQRDAAVRATRNYLGAGHSVEDTIAAIWRGLQASKRDPNKTEWTYAEAEQLVRHVAASPPKPVKPLPGPPRLMASQHQVAVEHQNGSNGHSVASPPPSGPGDITARQEPPTKRWNDLWNGEEYVARFGEVLRHCTESGWHHYDRGAWREDRTGLPMRFAKRMVRQMLREASRTEDDEEAKGLASWAVKCHASAKLESILKVAQTEKQIAITITEFDQDPVLLNTLNGTVNLRTSVLQEHRAEDLLSKQCPVEYDPTARCPRWLSFLAEVFDNDTALIEYIQRLFGFSATGLQNYHLLVFLWGAGRNGKTTMLETVAKVLGDYARSLSSEVLLMSRENGDYNAAQLRGARLAITSETGQHRRLDEARVKQLTGGDTVAARHPYGRPFTFVPTHHLWTMSNHKPQIEGMDHGIWSRVKLIEFANRFELPPDGVDPKDWQPGPHIRLADPTLAGQLESEQAGILNWLVQGATTALRDGLQEPASVTLATDSYREQMDVLGGFLDECCDVGPWLSDTSKRLYSAYKGWCTSNGVEPVAINKFGMVLSERGSFIAVKPTSGDRQRRWTGLQVKPGSDDSDR